MRSIQVGINPLCLWETLRSSSTRCPFVSLLTVSGTVSVRKQKRPFDTVHLWSARLLPCGCRLHDTRHLQQYCLLYSDSNKQDEPDANAACLQVFQCMKAELMTVINERVNGKSFDDLHSKNIDLGHVSVSVRQSKIQRSARENESQFLRLFFII